MYTVQDVMDRLDEIESLARSVVDECDLARSELDDLFENYIEVDEIRNKLQRFIDEL